MAIKENPRRWLYGWLGDKGSYMTLIRDRRIYARLDALRERMPEDLKHLGFNENGRRPQYGEYYFAPAETAETCAYFRVYSRATLRTPSKYPLFNSLIRHLSEMKEMFDIIEEVISESLENKSLASHSFTAFPNGMQV